MAVSVCSGTERRRRVRPVLPAVPVVYGRPGSHDGACGGTCRTKERGRRVSGTGKAGQ